jgi:phage-related protein
MKVERLATGMIAIGSALFVIDLGISFFTNSFSTIWMSLLGGWLIVLGIVMVAASIVKRRLRQPRK